MCAISRSSHKYNSMTEPRHIEYHIEPNLHDEVLNRLFMSAWKGFQQKTFAPILSHSLTYIGAFDQDRLIGFVNVAWDGGIHGFLLDTTVHVEYQRQGIGQALVKSAIEIAEKRGIEWLHVDYEPHLDIFYKRCGFKGTEAALLKLK